MLIAMTGQTKGLGKEFANYCYHKTDHQVIGFSRSNGYDIKHPNSRAKILRACNKASVFINLVHNYYHQTDLLLEFYKEWEDKDRLIINICSGVVLVDSWGQDRLDLIEYKNQKKALESMAQYLSLRPSKVQIKNYRISEINFGRDSMNLNTIIDEFQISQK